MLKFNNTSEVEPLEGILGQERAISAMEIGLNIDNPAYNMYLAGDSGTGKTTYAMEALNKYASQKSSHKDWVYVHNFENVREPIVIGLEKGLGKIFKKDIETVKSLGFNMLRKHIKIEPQLFYYYCDKIYSNYLMEVLLWVIVKIEHLKF